jgi:hypothetical protein
MQDATGVATDDGLDDDDDETTATAPANRHPETGSAPMPVDAMAGEVPPSRPVAPESPDPATQSAAVDAPATPVPQPQADGSPEPANPSPEPKP